MFIMKCEWNHKYVSYGDSASSKFRYAPAGALLFMEQPFYEIASIKIKRKVCMRFEMFLEKFSFGKILFNFYVNT